MSPKTLAAFSLVPLVASAYLPPVAEKDGVSVALDGFRQDVSDVHRLNCAKYPVDRPLRFKVSVANVTDRAVTGDLSVWLNDDWTVEGRRSVPLTVTAHATQTVERVAVGGPRTLAALYPVHAEYRGVHAIGVFEAMGDRRAWTPAKTGELTLDPATGSCPVATHEFNLEARGERFHAIVTAGPRGLVDGSVRFVSSGDPSCAFALQGFQVGICAAGDFPRTNAELGVSARSASPGTFEIVHRIRLPGGGELPVRATFSADGGALKLAWDMPGVTRDRAGLPRFSRLCPGPGDRNPRRVYCGFGNVIVNPRKFSFDCNGFVSSARHVGADYTGGLSLVQATAIPADRVEHDPKTGVFGPCAHHDNTFFFIPSVRGAFAAARTWRDVNGFRKSPGFDSLVGRMCFDEWGGDYRTAAENVRKAGRYGLNDSVFVKHAWQRWGYDYRLPEIYPPQGDADGFADIARACRETGVLFCPHDNYIDFYPDAEGYTYDKVVFTKDGLPQKAWFNHGRAAQSYRWQPHAFASWLERNCGLLRDGVGPDGLFIDVFTAAACFDYRDREGTFHPKTRTAAEWSAAFDRARGWLGKADGPMISEAGNDQLVGHVDAGQSDHFPASRWVKSDDSERVPWHDMGTHGRMILLAGGLGSRYAAVDWNASGDEALHGWASDDYLSNAVGGGRGPMCASPFSRRTVMTYWLQHDSLASLAKADFESFEFVGDDIHRHHSTFSNGGETWVNRATNRTWTVEGRVLPPYGYLVRTPEGESGIIERDGRRCAFARTATTFFADARPPTEESGIPFYEARERARTMEGTRLEVELEWTVRKPLPEDWVAFVHVGPKGAKRETIVRHGHMALPKAMRQGTGRFASKLRVDLGGLDLAKHDVHFGVFNLGTGARLAILGAKNGRIRLGEPVTTSLADRIAALGLNVDGEMVDFGPIRTNGALMFRRSAPLRATVTALPKSDPFRVELDLAKLGLAPAAKLVKIEPAVKLVGSGPKYAFTYDPAVESYALEFK